VVRRGASIAAMISITSPRFLAGAALAAAALAIPATAQAETTLIAGPLKVRDYQMQVLGTDAAKDSVTIMFSRTSGASIQMHLYTFADGATVTPTSITASLGRYGAIKLRLAGARSGQGVVPTGCTGNPGTTKTGTLSGSLRFAAGDSYFKTVTASKLKGTAMSGGSLECQSERGGRGGAGGGADEQTLTVTQMDGGAMTMFTATAQGQTAMRSEDPAATAPATVMHMISSEGNGLQVSGGGAAATVPAIGPFLGGTATFTGEPYPGGAFGELGGNLVAHFDVIGDVAFSGDATLMGGAL
jgi:hypothetical protein